jgi:ribosomal protein S18 acetylase RimI-like enzyme
LTQIRPYRPEDLEALYDVALKTGEAGADATALYDDPKLVGHIYAAPYAVLSPTTAFVAEDAEGVGGYIVGPADTRAFEASADEAWWPTLRPLYADPEGAPEEWTPDQTRAYQIHHPHPAARRLVARWPAHLHINLLPRMQGRGVGKRLMDTWLDRITALGAPGAHLGVATANTRGIRFYEAYGWQNLSHLGLPDFGAIYYGVKLPR